MTSPSLIDEVLPNSRNPTSGIWSPLWGTWCRLLPEYVIPKRTSPHFRLFALRRDDPDTTQLTSYLPPGVHGLREPDLPIAVLDALEQAYDRFQGDGRIPPKLTFDGKIPVYFFAVDDPELDCGSPQMSELYFDDVGFVPVIALASRTKESDLATEIARACAAAVHELSHVFNAAVLPYRRLGPTGEIYPDIELLKSWLWLDEALAVDAELELLPNVTDWLRYALDWVDRPDRSLVDPRARYQAAFFIRYLRQRLGSSARQFLTNLWGKSAHVWSQTHLTPAPVALTALLDSWPDDLPPFCSATEEDFFASGFCYDSYFPCRPTVASEFHRIFKRFQGRAVAHTWRFPTAATQDIASTEFRLAGLACHYLRFVPTSEQSFRLVVELQASRSAVLKAEIVAVDCYGLPIDNTKSVAASVPESNGEILHVELDDFSSQCCDHAILVVTNCSFPPTKSGAAIGFGQQASVTFKLAIDRQSPIGADER